MAVIKIPNGSGGWVKFPTIKGDKGPKGDIGDKGDKGDKGEGLDYNTMTPAEIASITGAKGDKGDKGDTGSQGEKGDKGDKGDPFIYSDFTPEQLVGLKGDKGDTGEKGDTGLPGSDANVTKSNVISALGYTPPEQDTITTINGKTGTILKTDIVALGIPAQDTVYTHPPGTNPHGTTKSDVVLGNVDNLKQMPISGGILENYREKLVALSGTSTAINLSLGNVFTHSLTGNTTYTITNAVNGQAHSFTLLITQTATVRTLTFPASVKWQGGEIPDMTTANKTYLITFLTINGGLNWLGMFGGEF